MSKLMIVEVPSYSCEFKGIREVCELVRCKECKHDAYIAKCEDVMCMKTGASMKKNDFCSYGQRKERSSE